MILDGIPYAEFAERTRNRKLSTVRLFIDFIVRKLGVSVLFDAQKIPFGRYDLLEPLKVAALLEEAGVLRSFGYVNPLPDEPPFRLWGGVCGDSDSSGVGGSSHLSDEAALFALLGEALERYLWFTQRDYFVKPIRATTAEMVRKGRFIAPEQFAAFSQQQRAENPAWQLKADAVYLWTEGYSLVSKRKVYVPAQTVSAAVRPFSAENREPLIRMQTTVGAATWPTQNEARLRGALECIERDAYNIMWLNQLTLPRVALGPLRAQDTELDALMKKCERYRLKLHAVRMLTDAPTHAICAVVEDKTGHAPRFAFGLKTHRSLGNAVSGATLEALRARRSYRKHFLNGGKWDPDTPIKKIGHRERTFYWGMEEHAGQLEFLITGEETEQGALPWEEDSPPEHLARIVEWSTQNKYECISVSPGRSSANPTPWYVETVVMPDLQSAYLQEWMRHLGGERLTSIPAKFGYTPRTEPFINAPHPYC